MSYSRIEIPKIILMILITQMNNLVIIAINGKRQIMSYNIISSN